jgi:tetratricopeptide (TPR) repeat protein
MKSHLGGSNALGSDQEQKLDVFLRACMLRIIRVADSTLFLDWIAQEGEQFLPEMAAETDPELATPAQFFRALGRDIWQATPLPHKNFVQESLPLPARNAPCHCGSGRPFRRCCEPLNVPDQNKSLELLPYLLEALPQKRWAELPASPVSLESVAIAAFAFLHHGHPNHVVRLLTPWFAGEGSWPEQHADLLDILLDAYEVLDKRKKRKNLATLATVQGAPAVAAIGWQRLAAMLTDSGDTDAAWAAFGHAQRADPDNVSLAALEITILLSQKKWEQASNRARFWAARISRVHGADMEDLLDYLRQVTRDPMKALQQINVEMMPSFKPLLTLLENAPEVACAYRFSPQAKIAEPLQPMPELIRARAAWKSVFPSVPLAGIQMTSCNAAAWDVADAWLPVLAAQPILWQDFHVLDDLVCALDGLNTLGLENTVQVLTARALRLLDCVLTDQHAADATLEWQFIENRPALRLVVRHILGLRDTGEESIALPWMERMVNQLNPHDNHGLRDMLMLHYLQAGDTGQALALGDRYPGDIGTMRYNRALAYFRVGRRPEADAILLDALLYYPKIGKALLAKRVAKPKESLICVNAQDEASHYRADFLILWSSDALAWLAAMRKYACKYSINIQ